ncbi:hypothetical protein U1839_22480 [Sphingomonas sp. RT2P30]|uniref:hypothetical protein n=1 Tax=Parasphingomonas halimpatiens TaxID=3096162 RepID=UPI002FCAA667
MTFLRPVSSRLAAALRGAFWGALVLAVTMALLPHPPALPVDAFGDKFEHVLAFSIMALLAAFAYPLMPLARIGERLSFLGALIEVFQSIPALHRDCDIRDWIADSIAIIVSLAVLRWLGLKSHVGSGSDGQVPDADFGSRHMQSRHDPVPTGERSRRTAMARGIAQGSRAVAPSRARPTETLAASVCPHGCAMGD